MTEKEQMTAYLAEVEEATGYKTGYSMMDFSLTDPVKAFINRDKPYFMGATRRALGVFAYMPRVTEVISPEGIKASIAHEVGHVALGHCENDMPAASVLGMNNQVREYQADRWAAERGYGPALLEIMAMFVSNEGGPFSTHPAKADRIAALKETIESLSLVEASK